MFVRAAEETHVGACDAGGGGVGWTVLMDTESMLVPQQLAASPLEQSCQADGVSLASTVKTS